MSTAGPTSRPVSRVNSSPRRNAETDKTRFMSGPYLSDKTAIRSASVLEYGSARVSPRHPEASAAAAKYRTDIDSESATDCTHTPLRRHKPFCRDSMTCPLVPHCAPPQISDLVVTSARTQCSSHVHFTITEQARPNSPLGCHACPITVGAKRSSHRSDNSHRRRTTVDFPFLGWRTRVFTAYRGQTEPSAQYREKFLGGHHVFSRPRVIGVEGHLLDESQFHARVHAPVEKLRRTTQRLTHKDGVHFQWGQTCSRCSMNSRQHRRKSVAARQFCKMRAIH